MPNATVADIVDECNGTGTGPYTIMGVGGVTSGRISGFLNEADALLRGYVGTGPYDAASGSTTWNQGRRFETNFATAKLIASNIGITVTDGFNYSLDGISVQRHQAQFATFVEKIDQHLKLAKQYITILHDWFYVYKSDRAQGVTEYGTPVTYWRTV